MTTYRAKNAVEVINLIFDREELVKKIEQIDKKLKRLAVKKKNKK